MKMRYGTNSSTLIHSLYLRFVGNYIFNSTGSFTSIFDAMPKFNFLVYRGSRIRHFHTIPSHAGHCCNQGVQVLKGAISEVLRQAVFQGMKLRLELRFVFVRSPILTEEMISIWLQEHRV